MTSTYFVDAAATTHVGRRKNNEDAHLLDADHGLFVVADGMGGYEGGEIASRLVVHTVHDFFVHNEADEELTWPWGAEPDLGETENVLSIALRLANRVVVSRRKGHLEKMGSTAVAVALDRDSAVLAHVGDSRVYRLREGRLEQLTRDHSLIEQMRELGATELPQGIGHVITKAIGFDADVRPDLRVEPVRAGDVLLLCSDGLSEPLTEADIALMLSLPSASAASAALVRAAYDAGGSDNITALVLRFDPGADRDARPAA
jgi:serine/threonine protein phosphatase PrpC